MGCRKVSAGCKHCYMFRDMQFYGRDPNVIARASLPTFRNPIKWAKNGKLAHGSRIFTCSWSDWFIAQADEWRPEAWEIVKATPYTYMILTKRAERIADCLPPDWGDGYPNVWLGVSAENQETADKRIPLLLDIPARVRFVSAEPLLGSIEFTHWLPSGLHWIITGGESGPDARPMNLDWARSVRDQCANAGTAFFHKQHGAVKKVNGEWGGCVLDGAIWDQFPAAPVVMRKTVEISCPECGSYAITPTTKPGDGQCEYRCDDCGHYFVDQAAATGLQATGARN